MINMLEALNKNNIAIWADDEEIELVYGETLPDHLIQDLKAQKTQLLQFLKDKQIFSEEAFEQFIAACANDKKNDQYQASHTIVENQSDWLAVQEASDSQVNNQIECVYPANSLQQGFVYHYLSQPEDDAYRVQLVLDYHYPINVSNYQKAWQLASMRYPILRTAFDWAGDILQVVTSKPGISDKNFSFKNIEHLATSEKTQALDDILLTDRHCPFDLSQPGLIRLTLIKQSENLYTLVKTEHHSISDGWSGPLLLATVHGYYNQLEQGKIPEVIVDNAYLKAQQYYMDHSEEINAYWQPIKAQLVEANDINYLLSQPINLAEFQPPEVMLDSQVSLSKQHFTQLKQMCLEQEITVNVALQFAWHKLLHTYTGDQKTIVGTTVSGRDIPIKGIESSVGLFINTLPLMVDWENHPSIVEQLKNIQKHIAELNSYSSIPLTSLQTKGQRLFHSLLVFENYPMPVENKQDSLLDQNVTIENMTIDTQVQLKGATEKVDYPLSIKAYELNHSLIIKLNYSQEYLTGIQAKRLLEQLIRILNDISLNVERPHYEIDLLSQNERHQLLNSWNQVITVPDDNHERDFVDDLRSTMKLDNLVSMNHQNLYLIFAEQVIKTPNSTAISFLDHSISYLTLAKKVDRLAKQINQNYFQRFAKTIQADTFIALYFERGIEMVIAILATLKVGAAYVPLSVTQSKQRIQLILKDCKPPLILTQQACLTSLNQCLEDLNINTESLVVEQSELEQAESKQTDLKQTDLKQSHSELPLTTAEYSDLAYVIYTSGTTGIPKGVMIEQRSVINLIVSQTEAFGFNASEVVIWLPEYIFDASVEVLFLALFNGAELVIPTLTEIQSVDAISRLIQQYQVTHLVAAASYLTSLGKMNGVETIRRVVTGGEACSVELKNIWGKRLINEYGPTETTVTATRCLNYASSKLINRIGKPIDNLRLYVLSPEQQLVPIGAPGELYIGGLGLARGYLNQPALTAEYFVENQFLSLEDKMLGYNRLYKTGDWVRWLPDGDLEYLGRKDAQVKINGYRIETGEIVNAINQLTEVKQSAVLVRENDSRKYLAAYIVLDSDYAKNTDSLKLKQLLSKKLADNLIPDSFTFVEHIPLTINGKLDEAALPDPEWNRLNDYVAPSSSLEEAMCAIWEKELSVKPIGVNDNFFHLGGNSIQAIKLIACCSQALSIDIPYDCLFQQKTITRIIKALPHIENLPSSNDVIIPTSHQAINSLSFAQERLLFIENFEQGSDAYHIPCLVKLYADTDLTLLLDAINGVAERHAVIKSIYLKQPNGEYQQTVWPEKINATRLVLANEQALYSMVKEHIARPFDLSVEPAIRLIQYDVANQRYLLILWHHIAVDGWSSDIFMQELSILYQANLQQYQANFQQLSNNLPELSISYFDYANWQRGYFKGEHLEKALKHWFEKLSGYENLNLPTDYVRPSHIDYRGADYQFKLDGELSKRLIQLAKQEQTTLHNILLSAFYITLGIFTGQSDIVIGLPVDNRHHQQTQSLIGLFVNSLAMRFQFDRQQSISQLIQLIHEEMLEAKKYQDIPFEKLVDALQVERDTSRHPIYQVMFSYETVDPEKTNSEAENLVKLPFEFVNLFSVDALNSTAKFDLSLSINHNGARISGELNYALSLFNIETIERIKQVYCQVLNACVTEVEQAVIDIDVLSAKEKYQLLKVWNQPLVEFPHTQTLNGLFEEQVALTPNNIALVFNEQAITYDELNKKANQLAAELRHVYQSQFSRPLQADDLIALYFDRSLEMVISILAVLKAGAAYVPMSPEDPAERINYILSDTQASIIMTQKIHQPVLKEQIKQQKSSICLLVCDDNEALKNQPTNNLNSHHCANDLAYIIYTSGTTGLPKGVMVEHIAIVNLMANQKRKLNLSDDEKVIWLASYVFDASVEQLLTALFNGGQLIIPTLQEVKQFDRIQQLIIQYQITHLDSTPGYLLALGQIPQPHFVRRVIAGGEPLSKALKTIWPDQLINEYGPTEATITATQCLAMSSTDKVNNIGQPVDNLRVYVLQKNRQLVPIGAPGELYIGGQGVARGYLNQSQLTAEKFVANPFATKEDKTDGYNKLYRTGDIVRWLPNGHLEYIGRDDSQVKIRGYRIELGEIENVINQLTEVKQSVVIDKTHQAINYLAAFIVLEKQQQLHLNQLRDYLAKKLPDYMLPSTLNIIEAVPLTINGKLNRAALPESLFIANDLYVAPRNALEEKLCQIWQAVLGIDKVGIRDNFFRIGGDSIVSIQLVSQLRQQGFELQVKAIFDAPTVQQLADLLTQTTSTIQIQTEKGVLTGTFDLLPVQSWFFKQQLTKPHFWNQAFMLKIPKNISSSTMQQALQQLAKQHDMLRCRFEKNDLFYQQKYDADPLHAMATLVTFDMLQADMSQVESAQLSAQLTQWQSEFNYLHGPLWRAVHLVNFEQTSDRLFFAFHHLIIDTVSWRIIVEDIRKLLNQQALPEKTSSYRQWVNCVKSYVDNNQTEINYWQQQVSENQSIALPNGKAAAYTVKLSPEETQTLLHQANQGYHTEINDLLLSALSIALNQVFNSKIHHITLEGHGRETIDESIDVSETVGWFTTTYPVKLIDYGNLHETIVRTKEMLRAIPNKGIGYSAFCQAGLLTELTTEVSFNYLGQFDVDASQQQTNHWHITNDFCGEMSAPENHDDCLLNINGAVRSGVLQFGVLSQLSETQSQAFTQAFYQALLAVIQQGKIIAQQGGIKTPSDYAQNLVSIEHLTQLQKHYQIEALYQANSLQQGFIFHHLGQPDDDAYRLQLLLDYHLELDLTIYQKAWYYASLRYPILRTAFDWKNEILQIVTEGASVHSQHFSYFDLSQIKLESEFDSHSALIEKKIKAIQSADRKSAFDLSQPGLIRFSLIKQRADFYTVLITEHHCISDGWSGPILLQTVHQYYDQLKQGKTPLVEKETAYLEAQAYFSRVKQKTDEYWLKAKPYWESANDLNLLMDRSIDLEKSIAIQKPELLVLNIQDELYHQTKALCQKCGVTVNVVLQFIWHKLLQIYTQDQQTIVGTTVSGRDIPVKGVDTSVGLYINTLPLVVNWTQEKTIEALLIEIQGSIATLNSYSSVSLASLQPQGKRLFHSLLVYENYPIKQNEKLPADTVDSCVQFREGIEKTDYPFSVIAFEQSDAIVIKLNYAGEYVNQARAKGLMRQLKQILLAAIAEPNQSHESISLTHPDDYRQVVYDWNPIEYADTKAATISELFEAQVEQTPDNLALTFDDHSMTYAELNSRANYLAGIIQELHQNEKHHHANAEKLIGLYLTPSHEMLISILAVLKAGFAYVPMATDIPEKRLAFILQDTQSPIVITQKNEQSKLEKYQRESNSNIRLILVDELIFPQDVRFENLARFHQADDLAYVIYTSGTTGVPKGVLQTHHNVLRLFAATQADYQFNEQDVWTLFHAYTFDFSVWEIWGALLHGGQLIIPTLACVRDTTKFVELCRKHQVSVLNQTPAAFYLFADEVLKHSYQLPQLRYVIFGGDKLIASQLLPWWNTFGDHQPCLVNMYGITETTVHVTLKHLTMKDADKIARIGAPLKDMCAYILDKQKRPLPAGVPGELYIGGAGVAKGYLNREALTQKHFVDNPFINNQQYPKMYKTGDVARWLPDGELEYLGRNDFQVKIRGYRIEIGEIESALCQSNPIKQALVIVKQQTDYPYLAAYLVMEEGCKLNVERLKQTLLSRLPDYMLPASFTVIDAIPLTINGKVDPQRLPKPDFANDNELIPPANAIETQLFELWKNLLKHDNFGTRCEFYHVGGNSILLIKLNSAINQLFQIEMPLMKLFELKTIQSMSLSLSSDDLMMKDQVIHRLTPSNKQAKVALLCVPYPGGDPLVFNPIADQLTDDIAVYAINFPRQFELKQTSAQTLQSIFDAFDEQCINEIKAQIDLPIVLWGYCGGSFIAAHIARLLLSHEIPVKHVLVAATLAFKNSFTATDLEPLLDSSQVSSHSDIIELLSSSGLDNSVQLNASDWQAIAGKFQKDLMLVRWSCWHLSADYPDKIDLPLHVLIAKDDQLTEEYLEHWENWKLLSDDCHLIEIDRGGHYFINSRVDYLTETISDICKPLIEN